MGRFLPSPVRQVQQHAKIVPLVVLRIKMVALFAILVRMDSFQIQLGIVLVLHASQGRTRVSLVRQRMLFLKKIHLVLAANYALLERFPMTLLPQSCPHVNNAL